MEFYILTSHGSWQFQAWEVYSGKRDMMGYNTHL